MLRGRQVSDKKLEQSAVAFLDGIAKKINAEFNGRKNEIINGESAQKNYINNEKKEFNKLTLKDLESLAKEFGIDKSFFIENKIFKRDWFDSRYYYPSQSLYPAFGFIKEEMIKKSVDNFINETKFYCDEVMEDLEDFLVNQASVIGKVKLEKGTASRQKRSQLGIDYGSNNIENNPNATEIPLELFADFKYDGKKEEKVAAHDIAMEDLLNQ